MPAPLIYDNQLHAMPRREIRSMSSTSRAWQQNPAISRLILMPTSESGRSHYKMLIGIYDRRRYGNIPHRFLRYTPLISHISFADPAIHITPLSVSRCLLVWSDYRRLKFTFNPVGRTLIIDATSDPITDDEEEEEQQPLITVDPQLAEQALAETFIQTNTPFILWDNLTATSTNIANAFNSAVFDTGPELGDVIPRITDVPSMDEQLQELTNGDEMERAAEDVRRAIEECQRLFSTFRFDPPPGGETAD